MKIVKCILPSAAALIVALGLVTISPQAMAGGGAQGGPSAGAPDTGGAPSGPGGAPDGGPGGGSAGAPGMKGSNGGPSMDSPRSGPGAASPGSGPDGAPGRAAEDRGGMPQDDGAPGQAGKGKSATDSMSSDDKAAKTEGKTRSGADADDKAAKTDDGKTKSSMDADSKTGTQAQGQTGTDRQGETGVTAEGRAQGQSGKTVRLEREQVTKLRTHFSQHRPTVRAIEKNEVSVSVGLALPGTIALYDLPPDVVVVEGACPIKYFLWGDDVVLVDSCTREVVEIIVGVA